MCSDKTDSGAPSCIHELMALSGALLLEPGAEASEHIEQLEYGAGHEDGKGYPQDIGPSDHIYGYPWLPILGPAVITMPHLWDADPGDATPSTYGDNFEEDLVNSVLDGLGLLDLFDLLHTTFISTENALQKSRHFWSLALGAYANGDKAKAYEYIGHIAHLIGDMTVPTHAHNDAHVDFFGDSDPHEEWMSDRDNDFYDGLPPDSVLTGDELEERLCGMWRPSGPGRTLGAGPMVPRACFEPTSSE